MITGRPLCLNGIRTQGFVPFDNGSGPDGFPRKNVNERVICCR